MLGHNVGDPPSGIWERLSMTDPLPILVGSWVANLVFVAHKHEYLHCLLVVTISAQRFANQAIRILQSSCHC